MSYHYKEDGKNLQMSKKIIIFILLLTTIGFAGFAFINKNKENVFISPLVEVIRQYLHESAKEDYHVVGFLPYWNLKNWQMTTKSLDEVIFFSFDADNKGNLSQNNISPQLLNEKITELRSVLHKNRKKLGFSVTLFNDSDINLLLSNQKSIDNLIANIQAKINEHQFDSVNIDFEYARDPTGILQENFIKFTQQLRESTKTSISVDFYSNTLILGDSEALKQLSNNIDYLIIMAYDFHRPGSFNAGPVAPLRAENGEKNILETLQIAFEKFPRQKLILAVPLYGYEWYTQNEDFASLTLDKPTAIATYKRVRQLLNENPDVKSFWDRLSLTPWLVYKEGGFIKQIYFENQDSIGLKIDLVTQTKIGGIGFWALGYEGEHQEIWQELARKTN